MSNCYTLCPSEGFAADLQALLRRLGDGDRLVLEPGVYHIWPDELPWTETAGAVYNGAGRKKVLFPLLDQRGVTVDGQGAVLLFHGRISPFYLHNCRDMTIRRLVVDYDRPFYSQGTILESDGSRLRLRIPPRFPYHVADVRVVFTAPTWSISTAEYDPFLQPFDPATKAPSCGADCCFVRIDPGSERPVNRAAPFFEAAAAQTREGDLLLTGALPFTFPIGHELVLLHEPREHPGFFLHDCADVYLEDIRLAHCGSMGIVGQTSENLTLRGIDVSLNDQSPGLVSINADATHFINCRGRILLEDCVFENMDDDAGNFHGLFTTVSEKRPGALAVRIMHEGCFGANIYRPGDELAVYRGHTMEQVASLTVRSSALAAPDLVVLEVAGDVAPVSVGDVADVSAPQPDVCIRRCRTGGNRPRGFLLSVGGRVLVEDCTFSNSGCGVHFTGDMDFWFESGPVRDVTLRRNVFRDCGYAGNSAAIAAEPRFTPTENAPYFHRNIRILDNTFYSRQRRLIQMERVDGLEIRGNRFHRTAPASAPERQGEDWLWTQDCGSMQTADNR